MVLGIELGSTRIKSVLIDRSGDVLACGIFGWENKLLGGYWTYSIEDIVSGVQNSYAMLREEYVKKYHGVIKSLDAIGVSAMMHGYLAFDSDGVLLTPFRTWRNTNTAVAAEILTKELGFNMPLRWSASHFYQAVIDKEEHVGKVAFLTSLAGYVHWRLTGEKALGVGDASGLFPICDGRYDKEKMAKYNALLKDSGVDVDFEDLLPRILFAGENAGKLTSEGARLLDVSGDLSSGTSFCPPEGDAGTGMVTTNAIKRGFGNVSAGTSAFAMIVLERPLSKVYPEIDVVTTPCGLPVAMVHTNNCTSEINAWAGLFEEVIRLFGNEVTLSELFDGLFKSALASDEGFEHLTVYGFHSGEPIAKLANGCVMTIRRPELPLTLANFIKSQICSAVAPLYIGMDILVSEGITVESISGHGGFFKTGEIGQRIMSAALNAPVSVDKTAGEGGAYGMALLALYCLNRDRTLEEFLDGLFDGREKKVVMATDTERNEYKRYMENYKKTLYLVNKAEEVR